MGCRASRRASRRGRPRRPSQRPSTSAAWIRNSAQEEASRSRLDGFTSTVVNFCQRSVTTSSGRRECDSSNRGRGAHAPRGRRGGRGAPRRSARRERRASDDHGGGPRSSQAAAFSSLMPPPMCSPPGRPQCSFRRRLVAGAEHDDVPAGEVVAAVQRGVPGGGLGRGEVGGDASRVVVGEGRADDLLDPALVQSMQGRKRMAAL